MVILMILDGFGHRDEVHYNAVLSAHTPHWNKLWATSPRALLNASGKAVGLPDGQMGNSEVGHLTMGAGRVVYQDLTRIQRSIDSGEFFENAVLNKTFLNTKASGKTVHVMGLLSDGGVHSHEAHWHALIQLALRSGIQSVCLHLFLDGRDTPPKSALTYLERLQTVIANDDRIHIATISGRYYAMDRDARYERTAFAYHAITKGAGEFSFQDARAFIESAYERFETDEFVKPAVLASYSGMEDGDAVVFMNFRADRARQLCDALLNPHFSGFHREKKVNIASFVTFTEYDQRFSQFGVHPAFPPLSIRNYFSDYISRKGLSQFHLAETEKYAHVTFFFNGGKEDMHPGEDRMLIPSPKVSTYDLHPEMSAEYVTDALLEAMSKKCYDFIIVNYANADMVGHSGDFEAAVKAVESLDVCLGRVLFALEDYGGELIITADHGNAEIMFDDETGQPHTAHTTELVPFVYVGSPAKMVQEGDGGLEDIAPTLLYLLGLPKPPEMTGHSLIQKIDAQERSD